MIPWSSFHSSELAPDWRIDLNEHNLAHFVDHGGQSPLEEKMNFSMLESAHERRFAIAQMGTQNVGFEAWHKARLEYTFQTTKSQFTGHPLVAASPPASPHVEDLPDLQLRPLPFQPLPPLEIGDQSETKSTGDEAPALPTRSSTTPLTLDQLMNPERPNPWLGKPNPPPMYASGLLPDSSPEPVEDAEGNPIEWKNTYTRAYMIPAVTQTPRTRRVIRQRHKDRPEKVRSQDDLCMVSNHPT